MTRRTLALALALVSCTSPAVTPATPPVEPGVGMRATFLLINAAGMLALDERCRVLGRITDLPAEVAVATPWLHPDRKSIVFTFSGKSNPTTGFGSDIYAIGLDGRDLRPLLEHEADNVFYASPRLDPSGTLLYVHRRAAIIRGGQYVGNEDTIERVDLRTKERRSVVRDAADPVLSPDGRTLVFVKLKGGQPSVLAVIPVDGGEERPFLRTKDTFWYLQSPRYSPNGEQVAFSAAGRGTGVGEADPSAAEAIARSRSGPEGRPAHLGVPSDLFISPRDGSALSSLGQTGDDVTPAWSPDGARIAYVGIGQMAILTVADESLRVCGQGEEFFFGELIWLR